MKGCKVSAVPALFLVFSGFLLSCLETPTESKTTEGVPPKGLFGVLVDVKGSPVRGASIKALSASIMDSVLTDSTGRFVFGSLAAGTYNLQGNFDHGSLLWLRMGVPYAGDGAVLDLETDTLKPAGQVTGRIDTRSMDAGGSECTIPGTTFTASADDSGAFAFAKLPPGTFPLVCRKDGYIPVSLASVQVQPERKTVVDPITMEADPAAPPPAPGSVHVVYDTVANTVRIAWSAVKVADLDGYLVFRNLAGSTEPQRVGPVLVRDAFHVDSLDRLSDTSNLSLVYRVKAQDRDGNISSVYSQPVSVEILAPLRTQVIFPASIHPGQTVVVKGDLRSGVALDSVETSIWSGDSDFTAGKGFVISSNPLPDGKETWNLENDAQLKIKVGETAISGKYVLRVVTRAGKRIALDSLPFELSDLAIREKTLTAGAQASTTGASIDLDAFTNHAIMEANAMAPEIDLVFAYSTSVASSAIYSPYAARNGIGGGPGFDFMSGMEPANKTEIKEITVDLASVETRNQVDSLWSRAAIVPNGRLLVSRDKTFLARSNKGLVVLIQVTNLVSGSTGTVTLMGKAAF